MQFFFLPYFGGDPTEWDGVRAALPQFPATAFKWDHIGVRGESYSVHHAIEDVLMVLQNTISDDFILVGHSMGGKIALGVAAQKPPHLIGVVLVAPSPPTPEPMSDTVRQNMLLYHGTREAAIEVIRGASHREISGQMLELAIAANLQTSAVDWKNWLENGTNEDISNLLPRVIAPVLVITGEFDENMTPALLHREIISQLPNARLEIVPDAGHLVPLEAPDEVAALLKDFAEQIQDL